MSYSSFAEVYDKLTFNVEYEKRAEYIHSLLINAGCEKGILLDLACGTGTLSRELAKFGYDMILSDISPEMLDFAREKLPDALLLCQDMTRLDLYGTVNCTVCSLDSVNHLIRPDKVRAAFERVALFTEPGGVFVFDVNTEYKHKNILADNAFIYEKDNIYCVWQNTYRPKLKRTEIALDIFTLEDGAYKRSKESFSERAYSSAELKFWLEECGFEVIHIYGDMTYEEPKENEERIYFVARKSDKIKK